MPIIARSDAGEATPRTLQIDLSRKHILPRRRDAFPTHEPHELTRAFFDKRCACAPRHASRAGHTCTLPPRANCLIEYRRICVDPSQPRETFVTDVTTVLRYNDHSALCNDRSATFPNAQRWNAVPERSEHLLKAGTGILDWITGTACMERLFFSFRKGGTPEPHEVTCATTHEPRLGHRSERSGTPFRPEPFRTFRGYSTAHLARGGRRYQSVPVGRLCRKWPQIAS